MANEYKGVSAIIPIVFNQDLATLSTEASILLGNMASIKFVAPFDGCIVGIGAYHLVESTFAIVLSVQVSGVDVFEKTLGLAAGAEAYERYMPNLYPVKAGEDINVTAKWASGVAADDAGETIVVVFYQVGQSQT